MSIGIIIKGRGRSLNDLHKDQIHRRRKVVEGELRKTIFSRDKMWQMDCKTESDENKRTMDYLKWKNTRTGLGKTNEQLMSEWGTLNRQMKSRQEEGRIHSPDDIRRRKSIKYD